MKLATWNLERGGRTQAAREAQEELLAALRADVVVLTEPPASYKTSAGVVTSPPDRKDGTAGPEAWVAIVGSSVEPVDFDVPYKHTAVAARISVGGLTVIVYGAVLPWLAVTSHAPELVKEGEDSFAVFKRVLAEQAKDIAELRRYGYPSCRPTVVTPPTDQCMKKASEEDIYGTTRTLFINNHLPILDWQGHKISL